MVFEPFDGSGTGWGQQPPRSVEAAGAGAGRRHAAREVLAVDAVERDGVERPVPSQPPHQRLGPARRAQSARLETRPAAGMQKSVVPPPPPPPPPLVLSGHAASLTPYQSDTACPISTGAARGGGVAAFEPFEGGARKDVGVGGEEKGAARRARARVLGHVLEKGQPGGVA